MRFVLLALSFLLVGAAPVDWTRTVAMTPEGGFRMGNPAAKVAVIEYASLTCPHCRDFHTEAQAALERDYIASGQVSFEMRNLVLNGPDVAVSVLARCNGPATYYRRVDAFYATQPQWMEPFTKLTQAQSKALQAMPEQRRILGLALAGKLDAFMARAGMPRAQFAKCLIDTRLTDQLDRLSKSAATMGVEGTPTFFVNGTKSDTNVWPAFEAQLRAKLGLAPKAG